MSVFRSLYCFPGLFVAPPTSLHPLTGRTSTLCSTAGGQVCVCVSRRKEKKRWEVFRQLTYVSNNRSPGAQTQVHMGTSRVAWQTGPPSSCSVRASRWARHAPVPVWVHGAAATGTYGNILLLLQPQQDDERRVNDLHAVQRLWLDLCTHWYWVLSLKCCFSFSKYAVNRKWKFWVKHLLFKTWCD